MQEKTEVLSEYAFRSSKEEFWRQNSRFLLDRKFGKSRRKIFYREYRPATVRSSGFQSKNESKGNLDQHVFLHLQFL